MRKNCIRTLIAAVLIASTMTATAFAETALVNGSEVKTVYHIYCTKCLAAIAEYDTEFSALAAWNQRSSHEKNN